MTDTDLAEALGALNRVTAERDTARAVAVRLEQENHALISALDDLQYDLAHRVGMSLDEIEARIGFALDVTS